MLRLSVSGELYSIKSPLLFLESPFQQHGGVLDLWFNASNVDLMRWCRESVDLVEACIRGIGNLDTRNGSSKFDSFSGCCDNAPE